MGGGTSNLSRRELIAAALSSLTAAAVGSARAQNPGRPGVIFDAPEPYRSVYAELFRGLESGFSGLDPDRFQLRDDPSETDLRLWLQSSEIDPVLALGQRSIDAYRRIEPSRPILSALTFLDPENAPNNGGVSLEFEPDVVIGAIKEFLPSYARVHVVFHPRRDGWLLDRASSSARMFGMRLIESPSTTLSESTANISNILRLANPRTDVLWLLGRRDGIVNDDTIRTIIARAWRDRFPVFSSSRGLVDRGFLLGGEPDFYEMGRQLAALALRGASEENEPPLEATRRFRTVLNVRTARRLGLSITPQLRSLADVVVGDE